MAQNLSFNVRIKIFGIEGDKKHAFGKGTAMLLRGITVHHSLNKAAKEMGMAYSKAWKSINATEEYLGIKLIERQAQRGSTLTEDGLQLLQIYEDAEKAAAAAALNVFQNSGFDF